MSRGGTGVVDSKNEHYLRPSQRLSSDKTVPSNEFEVTDLEALEPKRRAAVERAMNELDMSDPGSILFFGSKIQERLTEISDNILEGVRNKDIGEAGNTLNGMLLVLRGFDVSSLDPSKQAGVLNKLFSVGNPLKKLLQRYEEVRSQIDSISDQLERHKTQLLTDIVTLDRLYEANLSYFHNLADYITAGDQKLKELDREVIPALQKRVESSDDLLATQQLRDLQELRETLERRIHDLRLTRQVAMQGLPSIRLIQENNKGLINKITSVLVNTVPLWRQQLAQAVTIYRSREAGKVLKEATDLTNQLLESNAETLRQASAEGRRQAERSVFDIESVRKANELLIETIRDSLNIAAEGKMKRAEAERQLEECEKELRRVLLTVQPRPSSHKIKPT